jgi:hypothetical protein
VSRPELSVVLVTDTIATVREVLERLRAQSAAGVLELVLVAPDAGGLGLDERFGATFGSVRLVSVPDIDSLPSVRAEGVRAATAPVVVLGETHSFPDRDWAAALIRAHRGPWTGVGPAILNANPHSRIGWSNMLLDYGPWIEARNAGQTDDLPGHNSSFKRDALLAYGRRLATMMESDSVLVADLRARGHSLYLEPAARTAHLNVSRLRSWLPERVAAGREFASLRSAEWSRARRALYTLGSPLIPAVRFVRTVGHARRAGRIGLLPRVLPALALGLVLSAAGEALGYGRGRGSPRRLYEMELHRARHVRGAAAPAS